MTITRSLLSDNGIVRRYEVKDGAATIGYDEEPSPGTPPTNHAAIIAAARQALIDNRTYVGLASPTAGQTTAQVKALTRQINGTIRLLLGLFDGTD